MGTVSCKSPVSRQKSDDLDWQDPLRSKAASSSSALSPSRLEEVLASFDLALDKRNIVVRLTSGSTDLCGYSLFDRTPVQVKAELVASAASDLALNRMMGSMVGMAVGDALGHPFEFINATDTRSKRHFFDLGTFSFHGELNRFRLQRGQWTDDASMGLCMADSLILRRRLDGGDMRIRFWCWWNRGYNNAFRKDSSRGSSVGLGGNIAKSLSALTRVRSGEPVPPKYEARTEDSGNGSLMRLAPVALFFQDCHVDELREQARLSSYTTHPGMMAAEACAFLAFLIARAIHLPAGPVRAKEFLDEAAAEYYDLAGLSKKSGWVWDQIKWLVTGKPVHPTESCWDWRRPKQQAIEATLRARGFTYNGYPVSAEYFGAFALDGLALALWAVYNTESFDEAVVCSVNFCGDADSHGSITGQLAGALYGYTSIHTQFRKWLTKWDDHDFAVRALLLHHVGSQREPSTAMMPTKSVTDDALAVKVPSNGRNGIALERAHTIATSRA